MNLERRHCHPSADEDCNVLGLIETGTDSSRDAVRDPEVNVVAPISGAKEILEGCEAFGPHCEVWAAGLHDKLPQLQTSSCDRCDHERYFVLFHRGATV